MTKEYSRTKEDGFAFYSPHVTEHLDDLLSFTEGINNNPELASVNKSVVDILKEEKGKIHYQEWDFCCSILDTNSWENCTKSFENKKGPTNNMLFEEFFFLINQKKNPT